MTKEQSKQISKRKQRELNVIANLKLSKQKAMEELRLESWRKNGIKRNGLEDINQEVYLNHTYVKKFKALGFTYDSESEAKFLYSPNGEPVENEFTLDENGEFIPGVTPKTRKR